MEIACFFFFVKISKNVYHFRNQELCLNLVVTHVGKSFSENWSGDSTNEKQDINLLSGIGLGEGFMQIVCRFLLLLQHSFILFVFEMQPLVSPDLKNSPPEIATVKTCLFYFLLVFICLLAVLCGSLFPDQGLKLAGQ